MTSAATSSPVTTPRRASHEGRRRRRSTAPSRRTSRQHRRPGPRPGPPGPAVDSAGRDEIRRPSSVRQRAGFQDQCAHCSSNGRYTSSRSASASRAAHEPPPPARVVAIGEVLAPVAAPCLGAGGCGHRQGRGDGVQVRRLPGLGDTGLQLRVRWASDGRPRARRLPSPGRRRRAITPTPSVMAAEGIGPLLRRHHRGLRPGRRVALLRGSSSRAGSRRSAIREDQALQQRVGRQPVGTVHPRADDLAAGVAAPARCAPARSTSTPPEA